MPRPPGHGPSFEPRREQIIDLAASLMAKRGYAATGITELAETVGLGKGALYHYIGSKEKVLVEVQDRVLTPLLTATRHVLQIDASPVVKLRLASEVLLTIMVARIDHVRVYEHDHRHLRGSNRQAFVRRRGEYESLIRVLIEEAVADGSFREMDPRLATLQFFNMHNRTYEWFDPHGSWDATFLSREYCRTLFAGFYAGRLNEARLDKAVAKHHAEVIAVIPPGAVTRRRARRIPARTGSR